MSENFDDMELGFIDAALGAAKGIGKAFKAIGTAVKKKKAKAKAKKAAPKGKVIQMPPTDIVGDVIKTAAAGAKTAGVPITPETLTQTIAATVPTAVKQEVLAAIKDNKAANLTREQSITDIATKVDDSVKPQVAALLSALEAQQLSRVATHEHKELSARDAFRNSTSTSLADISKRLDEMSALQSKIVASLGMGNVAIVRRKLSIFGSKDVLEG